MGNVYRNPFTGGFALTQGLMGALAGGLKFDLDENVRQQAEQAEIQKELRLRQLEQQFKVDDEQRANQEWTRRTAIDQANTLAVNHDTQAHEDVRQAATFGHEDTHAQLDSNLTLARERQLQAQKAQDDANLKAIETQNEERKHIYTTTFDASMDKLGYGKGPEKGVYGSDGKFYTVGTPLPPGVTPTTGFGASNLGVRGHAGGNGNPYLSARTGAGSTPGTPTPAAPSGTAPAPPTMPSPASQADYDRLPSGTRYLAPDGTVRVKP